mgnify:FL=1
MIKYIFDMQEREQDSPELIELLSNTISDGILRSLGFDPKQSNQVIPGQKLFQLELIFNFKDRKYGLNLKKIPKDSQKVIAFLERLIKARQEERKKPGQWDTFLAETSELPDEFFDLLLGQFEDTNVIPITLSQLNMSLLTMLDKGVVFHFNSDHKNE